MKDTIVLADDAKGIIRSEEFAKRLERLVKTLTEKGALRNMARDKALALVEIKGRGLLLPDAFAESYIAILEKRSDLPRIRRDVIEMIGNTVMGSIFPGGRWEEDKEKK